MALGLQTDVAAGTLAVASVQIRGIAPAMHCHVPEKQTRPLLARNPGDRLLSPLHWEAASPRRSTRHTHGCSFIRTAVFQQGQKKQHKDR